MSTVVEPFGSRSAYGRCALLVACHEPLNPSEDLITDPAESTRSRVVPLAALTLLVVGLVHLGGAEPVAAAGFMCDGREATLVGSGVPRDYGDEQERLLGTEGPDVIVSNFAQIVDGRGGDDLICVTTSGYSDDNFYVEDGTGDDVVLNQLPVESRSADLFTTLGEGDDTYVGGASNDTVTAYSGTDDISGAKYVRAGVAGGGGDAPFDGRVSLTGSSQFGFSTLVLGSRVQPSTILEGTGLSSLSLERGTFPDSVWDIDVNAGTADLDGVRRFAFGGFRGFYWPARIGSFLGTDARDDLAAAYVQTADLGAGDDSFRPIGEAFGAVDLGEGDDSFYVSGVPTPAGGRVVGGLGRDQVDVELRTTYDGTGDGVSADLQTGELIIGPHTTPVTFSGMDAFAFETDRNVVVGTAGADDIRAGGCRTKIQGNAGDDRISVHGSFALSEGSQDTAQPCRSQVVRVAGGTGSDDLVSAFSTSILAGEGGHDTIRAGGILRGGAGNDFLAGRSPDAQYDYVGNERMSGGSGNDVLVGYAGNDVLVGDTGRDRTLGGLGRDTCRAETRRACER